MKQRLYKYFYMLWCCTPGMVFLLALALPIAVGYLHFFGSGLDLPEWLGLDKLPAPGIRNKFDW